MVLGFDIGFSHEKLSLSALNKKTKNKLKYELTTCKPDITILVSHAYCLKV